MIKITSKDNSKLKDAAKLKDRNERAERGVFFFEGVHLFNEFVKRGYKPETLFVSESGFEKYNELLMPYDCDSFYLLPDSLYMKITAENSPQGIFCIAPVKLLPIFSLDDAALLDRLFGVGTNGCIILESIRDPGNLGTIIRTAAALYSGNIILSTDCADIFGSKVIRASMGAIFDGGLYYTDALPEVISALRRNGHVVYAAAPHKYTYVLGSHALEKGDCIVIGNEGQGITSRTAAACDGGILIPMSAKTESLNAASAATVFLWELSKLQA